MKSEYRALIFVFTLMVADPVLYALGEHWGGSRAAIALPSVATLASYVYLRSGDRNPPDGPSGLPPSDLPPSDLPPAGPTAALPS